MNDNILKKVKTKIAISNMQEEDRVMKKSKANIARKIGIAACIAMSVTGVVFATTKIIKKFGENSSDGVQIAVDNEYYKEINTEYKESDGISVSIESFLIDDNNFNMNFKIKTNNENIKLNEGSIDIYDLKVVNEKNETVFVTRELEAKEKQEMYKTEEEARKNYDGYEGAYSANHTQINDNEIIYHLTATGNNEEFPVSKKLKVKFSKIRKIYWKNGKEKNMMYIGDWNYELDVPSEMAKSNIKQYKLVSISDKNYKLESAKVSNTAFKIYLTNCEGIAWNDNECVETSDGKKFYPAHRSDGDGLISFNEAGEVTYYNTFNLTNYDATDKLKVHLFKENGEEVIVELEQIK
jgi:hypothetical protein